MPKGSCVCGEIKYSFTGSPLISACHCLTCRKTSGVGYEIDIIIPPNDPATTFTVISGKPTDYVETGGSGKQIIRHFCPTCHTLMYMTIEAAPGTVFISLGTVDDEDYLNSATPQREIYTRSRLKFIEGWEAKGAQQMQTGSE